MYKRSHYRKVRGCLHSRYTDHPIQDLLDDADECQRLIESPRTYSNWSANSVFIEAMLGSYPSLIQHVPASCKSRLPAHLRKGNYLMSCYGKVPMYKDAPVSMRTFQPRDGFFDDDRTTVRKGSKADVCTYDVVHEECARDFDGSDPELSTSSNNEDEDDEDNEYDLEDDFIAPEDDEVGATPSCTSDNEATLSDVDTDSEEFRQECDESQTYYVKEILDSRMYRKRPQYKVRWHGFGPSEDSWEPEENLPADMVMEYKLQHVHQQDEPRSNPSRRCRRRAIVEDSSSNSEDTEDDEDHQVYFASRQMPVPTPSNDDDSDVEVLAVHRRKRRCVLRD